MSTSTFARTLAAAAAAVGVLAAGATGAHAFDTTGISGVSDADSQRNPEQVIVDSDGNVSPYTASSTPSAKAVPDCVGHYKPGNEPCKAALTPLGAFTTHKGCENRGRYLMANVHKETASGRVGYYNWGCTQVNGGYLVAMVGLVKVTDTNATHKYWG